MSSWQILGFTNESDWNLGGDDGRSADRAATGDGRHRRPSPPALRRIESAASPDPKALLDRYCVTCHNERSAGRRPAARSVGRRTSRRAAGDLGKGRPQAAGGHDAAGRRASARRRHARSFYGDLGTRSSTAPAAARPDPGAPALHRLNRTEYANAVRDLLDLPVDAASLLPGDDSSDGFDNIANVLSVSPALMQAYVSAAAKISRLAVGDLTISPAIATYLPPRGLSQADHLEGQPLGTRGGILVRHVFPLDAEYDLRIGRSGAGFGLPAVGADEAIEITLNGERLRLLERDAPPVVRLRLPAGPQTIGVAIVQRKERARRRRSVFGAGDQRRRSESFDHRSVESDRSGQHSEPPPDLRVPPGRGPAEEAPCATRILTTLAESRVSRGGAPDLPIRVTMLMGFYESGRALRGFETGIQYALARVLVDPRFIFRFEPEPADLPAGAVYRINDFELASQTLLLPVEQRPGRRAAGSRCRRANCPTRRSSNARHGGCWPILARRRSSTTSPAQWLLLRQLDDVSPADQGVRRQVASGVPA